MRRLGGTTSRIHPSLPIFRLDQGEHVVLYAPGSPVATTRSRALEVEAVLAGRIDAGAEARVLAGRLQERGRAALDAWQQRRDKSFQPECLTLYLSNQCNLGCTYCYAMPADAAHVHLRRRVHHSTSAGAEFPVLSQDVIAAAARLVARTCSQSGKPLTLVLHGGGEPTLHWDVLVRAWESCAAAAADEGVRLWSYIATHGLMTDERARWLARHFNLIGLSCDGPPAIHDVNRPTAARMATSAAVERTAGVLRDEAADYIVRATVTPASASRQAEMVTYLCDHLFAKNVRVEPAYDARRAAGRYFQPADAEAFVSGFLDACEAAEARGCDLQLSGVRIHEIHGPYCNPSRDVLQLTPDGAASACFLSVGNDRHEDQPLVVGRLDQVSGDFVLDHARIASMRRRAARVPSACESCHNVYHCARDCPDGCLLTNRPASTLDEGFRCRVQRLVGHHQILRLASTEGA